MYTKTPRHSIITGLTQNPKVKAKYVFNERVYIN